MGQVISFWRKEKQTIVQKLEQLEKNLEKLQVSCKQSRVLERRYVGQLLLYSMLLYVLLAVVWYIWFFPDKWHDRLLHSLPLLIFPILIYGIKRGLHWYFIKRIMKKESEFEKLKEKKKEILENVMEKETYKTAKDILDRFDPDSKLKQDELTPATPNRTVNGGVGGVSSTPPPPPHTTLPPDSELRRRHPQPVQGSLTVNSPSTPLHNTLPVSPLIHSNTGGMVRQNVSPLIHSNTGGMVRQNGHPYQTPTGVPALIRPILPRERSAVDKLVEYLVGDGPSNRYALICRQCSSHNGMALREEFEFIGYICAYCGFRNPARKHRPFAPRLEDDPNYRRPDSDASKSAEIESSDNDLLDNDVYAEDDEDISPDNLLDDEIGSPDTAVDDALCTGDDTLHTEVTSQSDTVDDRST